MSETPATDPADDTTGGEHPHTRPDLEAVQARIADAHDAEDHLTAVMPGAITADDDAYAGMNGPTEGDVEESDAAQESDDERSPESGRS